MARDTQEWVEAIRPDPAPGLASRKEGADQNQVASRIPRLLILTLVVALIGCLVAPIAGADGASAVAAKKGAKCKKKAKKGATAAKKKCKRLPAATNPGLPGKPLSPDTPIPPVQPTVSALTVTNNPVLAGTSDTGQVTLGQPAPAGGRSVTLQSTESGNPSTRASVPASVQVAAGQTTAGFPITTTAGPTVSVTIEATVGSSSRNVLLNVVQEPSVESVALDYDCFPGTGLVNFGTNLVTTDVPVPADTAVTLASDTALSLAPPPSVIVPTGDDTAIFGINTFQVTFPTLVTVTASLGPGGPATDTASVRDTSVPSVVTDLDLNPSSVPVPSSSTGTVTLGCEALTGGAVVGLASDNPDVTFDGNVNVTVPNGQLTETFPITTAAGATGDAVITATTPAGCTPGPGCASVQATLLLDQIGT